MSGPNPPGWESEHPDSASDLSHEADPGDESEPEHAADADAKREAIDDSAGMAAADQTDAYSRAYSAPESEHFSSGPYVPADLRLYDYDDYDESSDSDDEHGAPRWPWLVGVTAIAAAIALVVSVSLLVARPGTTKLATPGTTTASTPPMQDEVTTSKPPPPPTAEVPPPATETQTVTVTSTPPPPPPPAPTTAAPPPPATTSAAAAPPPPPTTTPTGPRQVTYSVTGTKAPGDIISVTYVDASGRRRTQHNVYIPWSMTVTPISQSDVGSVEASSLFRVSRLNCSITTSDGTVLSSNSNDGPQTNC
jgi:MmpS family membrane protein